MSDGFMHYIVNDEPWLNTDHPLYQEILRRCWELFEKVPDTIGIPDSRYNKRINSRHELHDVLIRGKRRGDVDVSVRRPGSDKWIFVFKHGVHRKAVESPSLAGMIVLPLLRRLMILDDLANA